MSKIEVAYDTPEAAEFVMWLVARGHDATVGNTTGDFVDGRLAREGDEASGVLNGLWDDYCNS